MAKITWERGQSRLYNRTHIAVRARRISVESFLLRIDVGPGHSFSAAVNLDGGSFTQGLRPIS